MKNLLLLVLTFITLTSYSQNSLDSLILNDINEYRIKGGLENVSYDTTVYKASKYHSNYMAVTGNFNHFEDVIETSTDTFGLSNPMSRYDKYNGSVDLNKESYGECIFLWSGAIAFKTGETEINETVIKDFVESNHSKISERTLLFWSTSPPHKDIIEKDSKNMEGGISTIIATSEPRTAGFLKDTYVIDVKVYITYNVKFTK